MREILQKIHVLCLEEENTEIISHNCQNIFIQFVDKTKDCYRIGLQM